MCLHKKHTKKQDIGMHCLIQYDFYQVDKSSYWPY